MITSCSRSRAPAQIQGWRADVGVADIRMIPRSSALVIHSNIDGLGKCEFLKPRVL